MQAGYNQSTPLLQAVPATSITSQPQALCYSYQTKSILPENASAIRKVYSAEMDDDYKWTLCFQRPACSFSMCGAPCTCAPCKFVPVIKPRRYLEVHENRIEFNDPWLKSCCGCCCFKARDYVTVYYFDDVKKVKRAKYCSPFHVCWCLEFCGEVVAIDPGCCGNCPCPLFRPRTYFGGIKQADQFTDKFFEARATWEWRQSSVDRATSTAGSSERLPNYSGKQVVSAVDNPLFDPKPSSTA